MATLLFIIGTTVIALLVWFFAYATKSESEEKKAKTENETTKQRISNLESRNSFLEQELLKNKDFNTALQAKLQELRKKSSDIEQELLKYKTSDITVAREIELLRKEKSLYQEKLTCKDNGYKELENKNTELATKLKIIEDQFSLFKQQEATKKNHDTQQGQEVTAKLKEAETQIQHLENELAQKFQEKDTLIAQCQDKLHKSEQEKQDETNIIAHYKLKEQELQTRLHTLEGEKQKLAALIAQYQETENNLRNQVKELNARKQDLDNRISNYAEQENNFHKRLQQIQEEKQVQSNFAAESQNKQKALEKRLHELETEKQELEELIKQNKTNEKDFAQSLDQAEAERKKLTELIEGYLKNEKNLKEQLQQLQDTKQSQESALRENKQILARHELDEHQLKEKLDFLAKELQAHISIIEEFKKAEEQHKLGLDTQKGNNAEETLAKDRTKSSLEDVLIGQKLVSAEVLQKAKEHSKQFGTSILRYLLTNRHLDENQAADCLCAYFKVPYVPVNAYSITDEVIKLVPVDIAQQHWLIPVEKVENILIVAMVDPFDSEAITKIAELTGCKVQVYVGKLSEVSAAIQRYYNINLDNKEKDAANAFFIDTQAYKGAERRRWTRLATKLNIYFPENKNYHASTLLTVSRGGFSFESEKELPQGAILTLQINLPKGVNPLPIPAVVEIARVTALKSGSFNIGAKVLKIAAHDLNSIMQYAAAQIAREEE